MDGVKGKSACAPYGKVNFAFVRKGSIGKGHPHYLFTEYKVTFREYSVHHSHIQSTLTLLTCLPTLQRLHIYY